VEEKIGDLGKPMIIGESGWQSEGYLVSSVCNLREYYIRITRHVYSESSLSQAMFFFNLNDEAWKHSGWKNDDNWGLYLQGDKDKIGDANGKAKFSPTSVSKILETQGGESCDDQVPKPSDDCCANLDDWPAIKHGQRCGNCMALVETEPYDGRCARYCQSLGEKFGQEYECLAAAEEVDDNCEVKYVSDCDTKIAGTSDMLCSCVLKGQASCTR